MSQRTIQARDAVSVTIREATSADVDALVPIVNAAYRASEGHVFPATDRVERTDAVKQIEGIVVAETDGRLVGCIHITMVDDAAHFGMLATDVSMQRRGIASALIAHAEAAALAAGSTVMRIETIKEAGHVPFYEHFGYCVTGETPGQTWNEGADWGAAIPWHMVKMEKRL
jgi:N-acetylglutamate synthase-like GNAT family acetyltransferase